MELVGRVDVLGEVDDGVLEGKQDAWVDFQGEVQVQGPTAPLLRMQVDLPGLPQRIRLDEMPFVVNMKTMVDRVILEVGHISGHIYDGHRAGSLTGRLWPSGRSRANRYGREVDDDQLVRLCHQAVDAVLDVLSGVTDWEPPGERPGQYAIDLVADKAVLDVFLPAGLGVLSEESGTHRADAELVAVVDPVDGSTNASRRIPWYASSVAVVDAMGPRAAVVANLATGVRYHAVRGVGAWRGTERIFSSRCREMREAVIALSGYPRRHMGWAQYRAFGAAALDLCCVAEGSLDAFAAVGGGRLGAWDYMGGMLLCQEAGASVADLDGADLVTLEHGARRAVAAAATESLMTQLSAAAVSARTDGV